MTPVVWLLESHVPQCARTAFISVVEEVRKRCRSLLMGGDSKEIEQMREDCLKITEKKTRHVSKTRGTS